MFVTWNDTKVEGETNNQNPDVFARGFDLVTNMVTSVKVYPNAVKDRANVNDTLTQSAKVTVEVTNLVGQQVMSLNKGIMNSGSQKITIDATGYNSGV